MDNFSNHSDTVSGPSREPFAVIPHDVNSLSEIPKRIYIGTGGNVTLRGVDAIADVTYKNVGSGVYLDVRPSHIRATGTTATDIIGEA